MDMQIKNTPVSSFIAVSVIVIFSLYTTSVIKSMPCGKNMIDSFLSNFVHIDSIHLFSNLYVLYALSRVELSLGPKKFFSLVIFLLCVNTVFETTLHKMTDKIPCSIGFSGVLFGILTWEIVTNRGIDMYIASSIMLMTILPSLQFKNVSLSGHLVGSVSGILSALLFNQISKL